MTIDDRSIVNYIIFFLLFMFQGSVLCRIIAHIITNIFNWMVIMSWNSCAFPR